VAELYDPSTKTFAATGSMSDARWLHTATLLQDGRVLIVGGAHGIGIDDMSLNTAEIYDPTSGTFALTASLANPTAMHTATLLANGQVLVAGGTQTHGHSYIPYIIRLRSCAIPLVPLS
jgi:hypothetical protein